MYWRHFELQLDMTKKAQPMSYDNYNSKTREKREDSERSKRKITNLHTKLDTEVSPQKS
jgi:hypothetical protein